MMLSTDNHELRNATRNLTGNRKRDIAFLKSQIEHYRFDPEICPALERLLSCLSFSDACTAAA